MGGDGVAHGLPLPLRRAGVQGRSVRDGPSSSEGQHGPHRHPVCPYLQAFEMALPPGMSLVGYVSAQIRAAQEGGADGYLFWTPRSGYTALWSAVAGRPRQRKVCDVRHLSATPLAP